MANPAREPDTGDRPAAGPHRSTSSAPRWVKVVGVVTAVAALLLLILMLVAGGDHGPARHLSFGAAVGPAIVAGTTAESRGEQW